jgi:hypothetical protein
VSEDRVVFTRPAAERIAKVVRKVEAGDRGAQSLKFERVASGRSQKIFRVCTYTGAWSIGAANTVTFKNQTQTPNTVSATNLFWPSIPDLGTRDCAIAKDGTSWYLIQVQWNAADVFTSATLSDTAITFGTDRGYTLGTAASVSISVTTCSTATAS